MTSRTAAGSPLAGPLGAGGRPRLVSYSHLRLGVGVAAICLLPLLFLAPFFTEPFENDEGAYSVVAQGMLRGELPYRDLFDHKPPLVYGWYAASFLAFGESVTAPRLMAAVVWCATSLVVFALGRTLYGARTAYVAAGLFSLSSSFQLLQTNANTEIFTLLPLAASLLCFIQACDRRSTGWMLAAGALGGLAALTKQVAVLNLVALVAFLAVNAWHNREFRSAILATLQLAAGSLAVLGLALVPFALGGALDDFYYANITYNRLYSESLTIAYRIGNGIGRTLYSARAASLLSGLTLLALLDLRRRPVSTKERAVLYSFAGSAVGIVLSGWFFPHYFVLLLPFAALISARFLTRPRESTRERRGLVFAGTALAAAYVFVTLPVYLQPSPEARHSAKFIAEQAALDNGAPALGDYLRANSVTGDTIYEYGRETEILFYSGREPAIRLLYDRPFWLDPTTTAPAIADLRAAAPRFILDTITPRNGELTPDAGDMPSALRTLLDEGYDYLGYIEIADVYRRKDAD